MGRYITCDNCAKKIEEDEDHVEVRFEGHMMVRDDEYYCMKCWEKIEWHC